MSRAADSAAIALEAADRLTSARCLLSEALEEDSTHEALNRVADALAAVTAAEDRLLLLARTVLGLPVATTPTALLIALGKIAESPAQAAAPARDFDGR